MSKLFSQLMGGTSDQTAPIMTPSVSEGFMKRSARYLVFGVLVGLLLTVLGCLLIAHVICKNCDTYYFGTVFAPQTFRVQTAAAPTLTPRAAPDLTQTPVSP